MGVRDCATVEPRSGEIVYSQGRKSLEHVTTAASNGGATYQHGRAREFKVWRRNFSQLRGEPFSYAAPPGLRRFMTRSSGLRHWLYKLCRRSAALVIRNRCRTIARAI